MNPCRAQPDEAIELLAQLRAETANALEDVRRLVYDLRPPVLGDYGLIEALRRQASRLDRCRDGRPLQVRIDAPETLPGLPAAVGVAVLVLTMFDDDDNVYDAMRAGARGYLLKGAPQEVVARAIFDVAAGGAVFGPSVASRLLARLASQEPVASTALPQLTARERQVLDLVAAGLRNPVIATRLELSEKTVGNHLSSIFAKLNVEGRSQAIIVARDVGLGRHPGSTGPAPGSA